MGQNKNELKRLLSFIEELTKQPGNEEFVAGLRALVISGDVSIEKEKLDDIYEYCIERNSRIQAQAFYKNFSIEELIPELVDTYVLMESFRRRGDFLNFSAHIFKQIEGITNYICSMNEYDAAFRALYDYPSCIQYNNEAPGSIFSRRSGSKSIGKLIYDDFDKTLDGKDKSTMFIGKQYIHDKVKIALYFGGYATSLISQGEFSKYAYDLYRLYLIRCEADHSGNVKTDKQRRVVQDIMKCADEYYVEFLKLLFYFVEKISSGYKLRGQLADLASSVSEEKLIGVVSSVLPSAMYVKIGENKTESVPITAYNRSTKFSNGMPVIITRKGGTIIKVIPDSNE